MDSDSCPAPSRQSTVRFRGWHTVRQFVGNARVATRVDEKLLLPFAQAHHGTVVDFGGRVWPSYHHAAVSLCDEILAAIEHAIDRKKVADIPVDGPLPRDLEERLRTLVVTNFDPAILQDRCAAEAVSAGFNTDTWRPPTPLYSGEFHATITTEPTFGDHERPAGTPEQFHRDCFYMLSALRHAHVAESSDDQKHVLPPSPETNSNGVTHDCFISYSQNDKPIADAACAVLEAAGIRCWIAPRDIPAGTDWPTTIVSAIRQSRVMVLILSSHAIASNEVQREVVNAFHDGVVVVPLRIEVVQPSGNMAYYMRTTHWLDALTPPLEIHLQRLCQSVREKLPTGHSSHAKVH
jgi:hypothetical protein